VSTEKIFNIINIYIKTFEIGLAICFFIAIPTFVIGLPIFIWCLPIFIWFNSDNLLLNITIFFIFYGLIIPYAVRYMLEDMGNRHE
jgi:hypothetical protein